MTYSRFLELFPDNDACLEYLKGKFFADGTDCPKCGKASKFHRITGRSAYSCQYCGHHVYPTAGTIFHKTHRQLAALVLRDLPNVSTRCGISAKQLEREIGVTYKTAHRMFKQIRTLLSDEGDGPAVGEGGGRRVGLRRQASRLRATRERGIAYVKHATKPTIFAMVERGGTRAARVIADRGTRALVTRHDATTHILPSSMLYTDAWGAIRVDRHALQGPPADQALGARSTSKATRTRRHGRGVLRLVQERRAGRLPLDQHRVPAELLDEYTFRYNRRYSAQPMFWAMLDRVEKPSLASPPSGS